MATNRRSLLTGVGASVLAAPLFSGAAFAQVAGPLIIPGGHYLSPLDAPNPIAYSDVLGATSLWSTPHLGESNAEAIHDGAGFVMMRINQLELPLSSAFHTAGNIYPVFNFFDPVAGPLLLTGPAWTTTAYGASVSGSGAACVRDANVGLLVNANAVTMYRGGTSYAVPAGRARLRGGIRPYANGLLRRDISAGKNRRCDVWNLNNRRTVKLIVTENGSGAPNWNWFTSQIAPRHLNGDSNNYADIFTMTPQRVEGTYAQVHFPNTVNYDTGIRWNNEVSSSGAQRWLDEISASGRSDSHTILTRATVEGAFGLNKMAPCETVESYAPGTSSGAAEVFGGVASCRCTVEYPG